MPTWASRHVSIIIDLKVPSWLAVLLFFPNSKIMGILFIVLIIVNSLLVVVAIDADMRQLTVNSGLSVFANREINSVVGYVGDALID